MSKTLVRVTDRKDGNVCIESMDGKYKETLDEETFSKYFISTLIPTIYEMIESDEINIAVELVERHTRWLTPHLWNILKIQNKASKGEKLSVTELATFGSIVREYCSTFNETQADFIVAVDSVKRLLEGDK